METLQTTECDVKPFEEEKMEEIKDDGNKGFDDESLVGMIKEYRVIWDTANKSYRDKEVRKEAWADISTALNKDVDVIKRRWKNLRDGMVRCLKKLDHSQHPGSGYLKTPMCRLFNELLFLRDCVQCTNTSMNLSDTEENLVGSATTPQLVEAPPKKRARHNVELSQDKNTSVVEKSTEKLDVYLTDGLTNGFTLDKPDVESSDWLFCRSLVGILEKMPSKNNRKARIEILQVLMKYEFQEDLSDEVDVEEGGEEGVQPEVVEEVERLE